MTSIQLTELALQCGCKFAIYKKSKLIKLCNEHYQVLADINVKSILVTHLGTDRLKLKRQEPQK